MKVPESMHCVQAVRLIKGSIEDHMSTQLNFDKKSFFYQISHSSIQI